MRFLKRVRIENREVGSYDAYLPSAESQPLWMYFARRKYALDILSVWRQTEKPNTYFVGGRAWMALRAANLLMAGDPASRVPPPRDKTPLPLP